MRDPDHPYGEEFWHAEAAWQHIMSGQMFSVVKFRDRRKWALCRETGNVSSVLAYFTTRQAAETFVSMINTVFMVRQDGSQEKE